MSGQTLIPGANTVLQTNSISLRSDSGMAIDSAVWRLAADGKVRGDGDMIFYNQPASDDDSVHYHGEHRYHLDLARQPQEVSRLVIACTADLPLAQYRQLTLHVTDGARELHCPVLLDERRESALILGECYRRNGAWKFRFVAQGYNGGLKPLSEHFGVDIADDAPPPAPKPVPASGSVNLSKITLDKRNPGVSLAKQADYGAIRINLNWNQNSAPQKGGLFGGLFNKNKGVDLDLGAFVRLQNGDRDCVQALGNRFGDLQRAPFVHLRGDDRTGAVSEGEWLDVNGSRWPDIAEILVFAFIYDGVPNWDATDGVVTLHVQGQQIETRLTEGNPRHGMCAIARLINDGGSIRVERINRYFPGHREMDQAFGWGFRWTAGSK